MQTNVWCEPNSGCPIITHPSTVASSSDISFTKLLDMQLAVRVTGKGPLQLKSSNIETFPSEFNSNNILMDFVPDGGNPNNPDTYDTGANINIYVVNKLQNPDYSQNGLT
jgi:hypothetical protein